MRLHVEPITNEKINGSILDFLLTSLFKMETEMAREKTMSWNNTIRTLWICIVEKTLYWIALLVLAAIYLTLR